MRTGLVITLILALAAIGACSKAPDEPTFDNPFDPNGTNPGTGYGLQVSIGGQTIIMTWNNLVGVGSYLVEWQDDAGEWVNLSDTGRIVAPSFGPRVQYLHQKFTTERTNWYRVTGWVEELDEDGEILDETAIVPSVEVALDIEAMVAPVGGQFFTPTRYIELELLTGSADEVEVSSDADFAESTIFPVTPGVLERVPWTLPTTVVDAGSTRPVENRDALPIYFRTRMAGSMGASDTTAVEVRFVPVLEPVRGLRANPGGLYMVDSLQVLDIPTIAGATVLSVERYHDIDGTWTFVEDITPAGVGDPVNVFFDPASEEPVDNRVAAEVSSDFGFTEFAITDLKYPLPLGDPEMEIIDGSYTTSRDIRVAVTCANAGYVILSEQADFAGATWTAWADTLDYQLEDVFGTRFLFAAYNNPLLAETKVTSTLVSLVSPPARARR